MKLICFLLAVPVALALSSGCGDDDPCMTEDGRPLMDCGVEWSGGNRQGHAVVNETSGEVTLELTLPGNRIDTFAIPAGSVSQVTTFFPYDGRSFSLRMAGRDATRLLTYADWVECEPEISDPYVLYWNCLTIVDADFAEAN